MAKKSWVSKNTVKQKVFEDDVKKHCKTEGFVHMMPKTLGKHSVSGLEHRQAAP